MNRLNDVLSPVLNQINWTPEVADELNQLINDADKIEVCRPIIEVRHVPITMHRTWHL